MVKDVYSEKEVAFAPIFNAKKTKSHCVPVGIGMCFRCFCYMEDLLGRVFGDNSEIIIFTSPYKHMLWVLNTNMLWVFKRSASVRHF